MVARRVRVVLGFEPSATVFGVVSSKVETSHSLFLGVPVIVLFVKSEQLTCSRYGPKVVEQRHAAAPQHVVVEVHKVPRQARDAVHHRLDCV